MTTIGHLEDALAECASGVWTGVALGRRETFWFTLTSGIAHRRRDDGFTEPDWADVYEIRCFTPESELRWWQEEEEAGRYCCVDVDSERTDVWSDRWLLWGTVEADAMDVESSTVWVRLAEARIGSFWVPVAGGHGAHVAVEVATVAARHTHGNAAVIDERFTRLVRCDEQSDEHEEQGR